MEHSSSTRKTRDSIPQKRALLVGINYDGTESQLSGCINDAANMKEFLESKGYQCEIMTDHTDQKPTRANILRKLLELITSDSKQLFFHYSGHGASVKDLDGDERQNIAVGEVFDGSNDGKDETLCPIDYPTNGFILDDELRGLLFCLAPDKRMFCVLDCCHSGTGMDLAFNLYERPGGQMAMVKASTGRPTRGRVVMISGCQDPQTSADAYINRQPQGALTYSFLDTMKTGGAAITHEALIRGVRKVLLAGKYDQVPNLSSGQALDLRQPVLL